MHGVTSHQGDVSVDGAQHLEDHLDLLVGGEASVLILLLASDPQRAQQDVGPCPPTQVLLLPQDGETHTGSDTTVSRYHYSMLYVLVHINST